MSAQSFEAPQQSEQISVPRGFLGRFLLMVIGAGLSVSAFGVWLVPSAAGVSGLMLMKLGVSLFMLLVGLCLLVISREI